MIVRGCVHIMIYYYCYLNDWNFRSLYPWYSRGPPPTPILFWDSYDNDSMSLRIQSSQGPGRWLRESTKVPVFPPITIILLLTTCWLSLPAGNFPLQSHSIPERHPLSAAYRRWGGSGHHWFPKHVFRSSYLNITTNPYLILTDLLLKSDAEIDLPCSLEGVILFSKSHANDCVNYPGPYNVHGAHWVPKEELRQASVCRRWVSRVNMRLTLSY